MKRVFDVLMSAILLTVMMPFACLLAAAIRLKLGSPVLFRQHRPGKNGLPFELVKFRTMTHECDVAGTLLPDAQRLSPFGRWLRSTSLDELPELLNVLRGDMSLVGPRPLLAEYLPLYSPEQARRHEVLPGITGWAQVNGRNTLSWEQKLALDVWYVDHRSFFLDIKILWLTVSAVFRAEGITQTGEATVQKFTGSIR